MKIDRSEIALEQESGTESWFGSKEQREFRRRLEAARTGVLLLDYDGTLAPFHADKMQAFPYPGVAEALTELSGLSGVRLVLVTGRRAADLERLLDVAKHVELWGSHGREHFDRDRKYTFFAPSAEQSSTLNAIQREIESALSGVPLQVDTGDVSITSHESQLHVEVPEPIEKKPGSLAIHWRGLSPESQRLLQGALEAAYLRHDNAALEKLPFEAGVEIRATGYTKAFPVNRILEETGPDDVIAYLGDDTTDEDAFVALRNRGLSILVRPELRPSHANYWLRPPAELLRFLEEWISASPRRTTAAE